MEKSQHNLRVSNRVVIWHAADAAPRAAMRRGAAGVGVFAGKKRRVEKKVGFCGLNDFFLSISDTFSQICEHTMLKML